MSHKISPKNGKIIVPETDKIISPGLKTFRFHLFRIEVGSVEKKEPSR